MTQAVTCPAEGCEYSGAKSSVLGHYSGMRDDAHTGGYRRAKEIIDETAGEGEFIDEEESEDVDEPEPDSTTDTQGGSDPIMGGGDTSDVGSSEDIDLPCGHESYDPGEAPDPPFGIECSTCGESWTVRE